MPMKWCLVCVKTTTGLGALIFSSVSCGALLISVVSYLVTFEAYYGRIGVKLPYKYWSYCLPIPMKWCLVFVKTPPVWLGSYLVLLAVVHSLFRLCLILLLWRHNMVALEWKYHINTALIVCLCPWIDGWYVSRLQPAWVSSYLLLLAVVHS